MECIIVSGFSTAVRPCFGRLTSINVQLNALLADSERSKLINKLSEANQQNRFLKRQLAASQSIPCGASKNCGRSPLQVKEDALINFKSELAVIEFEIQALVNLGKEIVSYDIPDGSRKINGKYIQSHLLSRLEAVQEKLEEGIEDVDAAQSEEVPLFWHGVAEGVSRKYIDIIKDMYEGASTRSALSPFLFAIVMDELTRGIQNDVPWCMMFADDIVLIDETKVGVQQKLELWRDTLEARGFRLSRSKTEYMECRFSDNSDREAEMITFDGKVVHGSTFFRYLGSIIQKDGELDGDVAHRIKAGWLKWKSATGVLCDPDMPHRLKGKFYRTAIRPALLYGTECWAVKQCHVQKMNVAEMRMLRWMCGHTKKDRLRNEVIREKVRVASIEDKMMENRLRWFGHVRRRPVDAPVRRLESWRTINII
ncbi:hypothetical protein OROGR_018138 [Orobanche gracilis]